MKFEKLNNGKVNQEERKNYGMVNQTVETKESYKSNYSMSKDKNSDNPSGQQNNSQNTNSKSQYDINQHENTKFINNLNKNIQNNQNLPQPNYNSRSDMLVENSISSKYKSDQTENLVGYKQTSPSKVNYQTVNDFKSNYVEGNSGKNLECYNTNNNKINNINNDLNSGLTTNPIKAEPSFLKDLNFIYINDKIIPRNNNTISNNINNNVDNNMNYNVKNNNYTIINNNVEKRIKERESDENQNYNDVTFRSQEENLEVKLNPTKASGILGNNIIHNVDYSQKNNSILNNPNEESPNYNFRRSHKGSSNLSNFSSSEDHNNVKVNINNNNIKEITQIAYDDNSQLKYKISLLENENEELKKNLKQKTEEIYQAQFQIKSLEGNLNRTSHDLKDANIRHEENIKNLKSNRNVEHEVMALTHKLDEMEKFYDNLCNEYIFYNNLIIKEMMRR